LAKFYENDKKFFTDPNVEVILPEVEILEPWFDEPDYGEKLLRRLERAIRTAYQSFDRIGPDSHYKLLKHILTLHHESTLEHEKITFKVITNRGVTHELVRHRIASYTQESTRYVKYWKKHWYKIIYPTWLKDKTDEEKKRWYQSHLQIANFYWKALNEFWWKAQEARWLLPNDIKTEIVVTMNLRELRHFLKLRWDKAAHPDIRVIAHTLLKILKEKIPLIFDDINYV
jgi:thymidylate synthase (FAD)